MERYISKDSLTQIKVEHSRIRNVFGDDNRFSYQYSDIDGSLFIKPILIMESEQSEKQNEVQNKQIGQNEQIQQEKKDRKDNGEKKEDKNSKNNFFKSVGRIEENKNGKDEKSEDGGKNKKGLEIQQGQKDQQQSQQIIKSEIIMYKQLKSEVLLKIIQKHSFAPDISSIINFKWFNGPKKISDFILQS